MTTANALFEASEAHIGREIASALHLSSNSLPHDLSERLRVARLAAVAVYRQQNVKTTPARSIATASFVVASGTPWRWWNRLANALPLVLLVMGLLGISQLNDYSVAIESAATDLALLTDELPPSAYSDPGFIRFIKMQEQAFSSDATTQ